MNHNIPHTKIDEAIQFLEPFVTEKRSSKMREVLSARTIQTIPVLEGIFDMGNLHAVVRTAEGLGFQRLEVIESLSHYRSANRVTQGTDKWIEITKWKNTTECLESLKGEGFLIACSNLSPESIPLESIDFSKKIALIFGNEKRGVTPEALAMADIEFRIPMCGFAQSFNISVAAAIALSHARREISKSPSPQLSEYEIKRTYAEFLLQSVPNPEAMLERLLNS